METKKEMNAGINEYITRVTMPIFNRVLKETPKNQPLVGKVGFSQLKNCHYQPHNYRLYIDFSRANFNPQNQPLDVGFIYYKVINSTEHLFMFENFNIRVKKNQIQIQNKVENKRWHVIEVSAKANQQIIQIFQRKDNECIEFLKTFIKIFGGISQFKILNRFTEDKIRHEDIIDLLPLKQKFHNKVVKKVYNEKNVEFSNPALACNYITNRAIENIAPTIARAIETINPLHALKNNIKSIEDVLKNSHLVNLLSTPQKRHFEKWLFRFSEAII